MTSYLPASPSECGSEANWGGVKPVAPFFLRVKFNEADAKYFVNGCEIERTKAAIKADVEREKAFQTHQTTKHHRDLVRLQDATLRALAAGVE